MCSKEQWPERNGSQIPVDSFLELTVERRIMPDTATPYAGIIIRTRDGADSSRFPQKVLDALRNINSTDTGRRLLAAIASRRDQARYGNASTGQLAYTVCIMPKKSIKQSRIFGSIRWRNYEPGSVTHASNEAEASTPNQGSVSAIRWDPVHTSTPDGSRPPFIALAHELIHAWRNLCGNSYLNAGDGTLGATFTGSGEAAKDADEMKVVGLRGFEQEPITENRIRAEHGLPYRTSYASRCSAADGTPDVTLLGGPPRNDPWSDGPPRIDPIGI
jgi:hypothetical protein